MSFVKSVGTLMVQNSIQILCLIFPVCIGKVTWELRVFWKLTACVSVNSDGLCFPSADIALPDLLQGLWAKVGNVMKCPTPWSCQAPVWCNSSHLLTLLGSTCSCPSKHPIYFHQANSLILLLLKCWRSLPFICKTKETIIFRQAILKSLLEFSDSFSSLRSHLLSSFL